MNVELARTFLQVVDGGSLARAAEHLNVTHSTVTMRIKALEDILRSRLLIRNRSGVSMTAAGRRFYPLAESLTRTWQMTRRQMSLGSGFDGLLSIGAPSLLWDDMMFDWAVRSRRQRPELAIRCESGDSEQLIERLFQGGLDVCLVFEPRSRSGFTVEELFKDPLVVVSTEDRQPYEIWDPDYIEIEWEEGVKRQEETFFPDIAETPHLSTRMPELGLRFLQEFGGSVLIPERVLNKNTFPVPLYRVPRQPMFEQTVYLVYSEAALKERFSKMPVAQLRASLINQIEGKDVIWDSVKKPKHTMPPARSSTGS